PTTGTWTVTHAMSSTRSLHTMTLLLDGKVLVAGSVNSGTATSTELYDVGLGFSNSWRPQITAFTSSLSPGDILTINGSRFRGVSECSSGNSQDSASDYPLVQLRNIENGQTLFLSETNWSENSSVSGPVWNIPPGEVLATIFVNGIQS